MRRLPLIAILIAVACSWSCREERRSFVPNAPDGVLTPTMTTNDVSTFISDSGYTRYHITTPVWQMFEDAPEPYWRFPDGLFLEQYDENLRPAANVSCDSATYMSRQRLWRLDGNVVMVNVERDSFLTHQLFWDQQRQTVYSDSFIHIVREDRIIEGYGFKSNQNMTAYTVMQPTGIFPVERPAPRQDAADDATADSTVTDTYAPRRRPTPTRASERRAAPMETDFTPDGQPSPMRPVPSNN